MEQTKIKLSIAYAIAEKLWIKGLLSDDELAKVRNRIEEKIK